MDEFIKLLDPGLDYISHEILDDTIIIRVASNKTELCCPYCGHRSSKKHSTYERSFQDLPIMEKKSKIIIQNRKMFCLNPECKHTTFAETFPLYNTTRNSKIKPFAETIKHMLESGYTFKEIESSIKKDGYTGASSTIRMFATRERKLIQEAQKGVQGKTEKIERKWLISLLYKPIDKVQKISQEQLDRVIEQYPQIGEIYDIVGTFKNMLFSKNPNELEKWMEDAETLDIPLINRFVNGIRRDLSAVKKAIELDYNNGLAEGSVNKLKVIKRIMYGRCSFELLKGKLLRLELKRKIN